VPAHNEEPLLETTLHAIHAAGRALAEPYEVIVVDDASTDGTAAVAGANGARVVPVCVRQIAAARNAGARAAAGSVLIFVDADTVASAAAVTAAVAAVRSGAAGGGARVDFDGRIPLWARACLALLRIGMRIGRLAAGCFIFCSRAAFEAVGGFDEGLYAAEEIAFSRALGRQGPVVILREAVNTSGRKMRTHSTREIVRFYADVLRLGKAVVRSRDALSLWYGERRHDRSP
jgi:glycosyltransferase involved in cell wall biosynthesis